MSASNVPAKRAAWLTALCADRSVTLVPLRVAVVIGNHINGMIGEAWPSQSTIAKLIGMNRANVNRAVAELVDLGYLAVSKRGQNNRYIMATPRIPGGNTCTAGLDADEGQQAVALGDTSPVSPEATDPYLRGHPIYEEPRLNSEGRACGAPLSPPESMDMDTDDLSGRLGAASPFQMFSEIYPANHLGHCRVAFEDALEIMGMDAIVKAGRKYANAVSIGQVEPMPAAHWLRLGVERYRIKQTTSGSETNVA